MAAVTKDQIVEKLTALGLEFDTNASKAELAKILREATGEVEKTAVTLKATNNRNGASGAVRTFSLEQHGENWQESAEEWKKAYEAVEIV